MRVTACDACGRTDEDEEPVGWLFVNVVLEEREDRASYGIVIGGGTPHRKRRRHTLCSEACLAAFTEMEIVKQVRE